MRTNLRLAAPFAVDDSPFAREVLAGLAGAQKTVPGRWLHDARGAALFERLTRTPEHYPARTEALILHHCAAEIAILAGPDAGLVEIAADVEPPQRLPAELQAAHRPVVFIPGATTGRLAPEALAQLLRHLARLAGARGLLIVGADATQDPSLLLPAYADAQGAAEAFNKNLLVRLNRELGADVDLEGFRHAARYDTRQRRIEMHLVSRREQWVRVAGRRFHFDPGESIHSESAYKHSLLRIRSLAAGAGWSQRQLWTDAHARFGVQVFERFAS